MVRKKKEQNMVPLLCFKVTRLTRRHERKQARAHTHYTLAVLHIRPSFLIWAGVAAGGNWGKVAKKEKQTNQ